MSRNILIVDRSATIRRILRTMILANINDADVAEATDTGEAMAVLDEATTHLVLFSRESCTENWLAFIEAAKLEPQNKHLNFVLFSSRPDEEHFSPFKEAGVATQLGIPCTPAVLTKTINCVCNPTLLRTSRRYNVPDATATLSQGAVTCEAKVINTSLGGMLCEMAMEDKIHWGSPMLATLQFPGPDGPHRITNLFVVTARFFVQERNSDHSPKSIRVALLFLDLSEEAEATLTDLFCHAEAQEAMGFEDL